MHTAILNPLNKNDLKILVGKDNLGFPTFQGTI